LEVIWMLQLTPDAYERFVARNWRSYRKLFEILGMGEPSQNLVELHDATFPVWVADEFGGELPGDYTDAQLLAALPVLVDMELFNEHRPPALDVPVVFYNTGRKYAGMEASWAGFDLTLASNRITLGVCAFGSRPYTVKNDGTIAELIQRGRHSAVLDVPWVERMFLRAKAAKVAEDPEAPKKVGLTEFDLGVYSALCYYGPDAVQLPKADSPSGGQSYMFIRIKGVPFVVVGAPPTEQHGDYFRPKSRGAADEAMNVVPLGDETFVINGGPPHLRVCVNAMFAINKHYPGATGYAVIRKAMVLDQDPPRAARLGLHEAALWVSSTGVVRTEVARRKAQAAN
jgi:hypothetical protein